MATSVGSLFATMSLKADGVKAGAQVAGAALGRLQTLAKQVGVGQAVVQTSVTGTGKAIDLLGVATGSAGSGLGVLGGALGRLGSAMAKPEAHLLGLQRSVSKVGNQASAAFRPLASAIQSPIASLTRLKDVTDSAIMTTGKRFTTFGGQITSGLKSGVAAVKQFPTQVKSSIDGGILGAGRGLTSLGSTLVGSLKAGGAAVGRFAGEVRAGGSVLGGLAVISRKVAPAVSGVGSSLTSLGGGLSSLGGKISITGMKFGSLSGAAGKAFGAVGSGISGAASKMGGLVGAIGSGAGRVAGAFGSMASSAGSAFSRIAGSAGSVMSSLGGIASKGLMAGAVLAGMAVGWGVKLAAQSEQAAVGFRTLLGSEEAAQQMMVNLKDFAQKTPFEFAGLRTEANHLLALGFDAQQIIPMLRTLGDATSALGGDADHMQRLAKAFGDMKAKGKVATQELNQLSEAGINARQILADKLGVDVPTAMKMVEDGTVSAAMAIPAIMNGMTAKFGGGMEAQSKTMLGIWTNTVESVTHLFTDIGQVIIDALDLKGAATGVMGFVENLRSGMGTIAPIVAQVAHGLMAWGELIVSSIGQVAGMFGLIPSSGQGVLDFFLMAEFLAKNWGTAISLGIHTALLSVVQFGAEFGHFFTAVVPAYFTWFTENWRSIWMGAAQFILTPIKNIIAVVQGLFNFIASGGKADFKVTWASFTDGFKDAVKKLPNIPARVTGEIEKGLQNDVKNLGQELQDNYADLADKREKERKALEAKFAAKPLVTPETPASGDAAAPFVVAKNDLAPDEDEEKKKKKKKHGSTDLLAGGLAQGSGEALSAVHKAMAAAQGAAKTSPAQSFAEQFADPAERAAVQMSHLKHRFDDLMGLQLNPSLGEQFTDLAGRVGGVASGLGTLLAEAKPLPGIAGDVARGVESLGALGGLGGALGGIVQPFLPPPRTVASPEPTPAFQRPTVPEYGQLLSMQQSRMTPAMSVGPQMPALAVPAPRTVSPALQAAVEGHQPINPLNAPSAGEISQVVAELKGMRREAKREREEVVVGKF